MGSSGMVYSASRIIKLCYKRIVNKMNAWKFEYKILLVKYLLTVYEFIISHVL